MKELRLVVLQRMELISHQDVIYYLNSTLFNIKRKITYFRMRIGVTRNKFKWSITQFRYFTKRKLYIPENKLGK